MSTLYLSCFVLFVISIKNVPVSNAAADKKPISSYYFTAREDLEKVNLRISRAIHSDKSRRWPSNVIPYEINPKMPKLAREKINETIALFHNRTCVRFVRKSRKDRDYIYFTSIANGGCSSAVGRVGGRQIINLDGEGCFGYVYIIAHEIMHALGFHHEQERVDRDDYVKIHYGNIKPDREDEFEIEYESDDITLPYDFNSVMHYGPYYFTKNGKPTMSSKVHGIGLKENEELDLLDLLKINFLFKCIPGMEDLLITANQY